MRYLDFQADLEGLFFNTILEEGMKVPHLHYFASLNYILVEENPCWMLTRDTSSLIVTRVLHQTLDVHASGLDFQADLKTLFFGKGVWK